MDVLGIVFFSLGVFSFIVLLDYEKLNYIKYIALICIGIGICLMFMTVSQGILLSIDQKENQHIQNWGVIFAIVLTIVFSITQSLQTRKHNRISVIPKLNFSRYISPRDNSNMGFSVKNVGIGPAKLIDIKFSFKSGINDIPDAETLLLAIFDRAEFQIDREIYFRINNYRFVKGDYLEVGETVKFIDINTVGLNIVQLKTLETILLGIDAKINYESVYGKKYSTPED